jgi:acetylornithine deacetylase/succinyl-diaminopimelate desuccinylase-like protein
MMYNQQTNGALDFSPFEPVIKTTDIHQRSHFARGACDDKGSTYT